MRDAAQRFPDPSGRAWATGIGWLMSGLFSFVRRPETASADHVDALNPASQGQSAQETAAAAVLTGGWLLLATGWLLIGQPELSAGSWLLRLILWPFVWVAVLHALVLLPPLLLLPWSLISGHPPVRGEGWHEACAHTLMLGLAWWLVQAPAGSGRLLGWFWILLILLETALRLLRAGLRLARRPD